MKPTVSLVIGLKINMITITLPLVAVSLYLIYIGYIVLSISIFILILAILLNNVVRRIEASRNLEEELPFIILLSASAPITGFEFFEVLDHIRRSSSNVFREFKKLAIKIYNLLNLLNVDNVLNIASAGISSNRVRLFLRDHAAGIVNGTSIDHLDYSATEYIKEYHRKVVSHLNLRSNFILMSSLIFTVIPLILIGLIPLIGSDLPLKAILAVIVVIILLTGVFPRYPLILSIVENGRSSRVKDRKRSLRSIVPVILLSLFPIFIYTSFLGFGNAFDFVGGQKVIGISIGMILTAVGIYNFRYIYIAFYMINRLKRIYNFIGQYARTYRTLQLVDLNCDESGAIRVPWLFRFTCFSLEYLKNKGEINPVHIDRFVDYIIDLLSIYRSYIIVVLLIFAVSVIQPYIFYNLITVSYISVTDYIIYAFILVPYFFSILSSRLAFDSIDQTALPGIVTVLLSLYFW